jgi:hypothetical protein
MPLKKPKKDKKELIAKDPKLNMKNEKSKPNEPSENLPKKAQRSKAK